MSIEALDNIDEIKFALLLTIVLQCKVEPLNASAKLARLGS